MKPKGFDEMIKKGTANGEPLTEEKLVEYLERIFTGAKKVYNGILPVNEDYDLHLYITEEEFIFTTNRFSTGIGGLIQYISIFEEEHRIKPPFKRIFINGQEVMDHEVFWTEYDQLAKDYESRRQQS